MSTASVIKIPRRIAGLRAGGYGEDEPVAAQVAGPLEEDDSGAVTRIDRNELELLHSRIEQLGAELQSAREESYEAGFQDGLAAEQKKLNEALETHVQHLRDLAERLEEEFDRALSNLEEPLLRMSFRISEKILKTSLPETVQNESLVANIQSFLREVLHEGSVVIHVSTQSMALVQSAEVSEKLKQSFPGRMRFVADERLRPGECRVETPEHIIDGGYSNQLSILESKLK
ncbi:MAG: FliH/SctL family protein [Candidatus Neomarinimicrobiota bacterium]